MDNEYDLFCTCSNCGVKLVVKKKFKELVHEEHLLAFLNNLRPKTHNCFSDNNTVGVLSLVGYREIL